MKKFYELTNPQKNIWNMENYFNGITINNICSSVIIKEDVDENILKKALNNIVKKNDSFRIKLSTENGVIKQSITEFEPFHIDTIYANEVEDIDKIEQQEVKNKFEMINSRLFDFKVVKFKNNYGAVVLTLNHIISDSWSLGLTAQEIVKEYKAVKNNYILPENENKYENYINSEEEYKKSNKYEKDKKYWKETFSTIPELAVIPATKKTGKNISPAAKRTTFSMDKKLVMKINEMCQNYKVSLFNFFMSIFSIYIGRVSNLDDFVIGTPILNRTNFKEKNTMGIFINTVPVRINIPSNSSFAEFAHAMGINIMNIFKHQKYSYNEILEDIRNRNQNIPNLYNILFSYQITKAYDKQYGDYVANWAFNNYCGNDVNIHVLDLNDTGDLQISYDYLTDKYTTQDIKLMHNRIIYMINQIIDNEKINTNEIEIVTQEEKNQIINEFNNTKNNYPKEKTIIDLFEEQVQKNPNDIAIVFKEQKLTYKELNEKANCLASYLQSQGVKQEEKIATFLDKSVEMIIAILAILKTGACYVPIDTEYPENRINYMLEDANIKYVLSLGNKIIPNKKNIDISINNKSVLNSEVTEKYYNKTDENKICENAINKTDENKICENAINKTDENKVCENAINKIENIYENGQRGNLKIDIKPNNLAYIMYTSGSTGKPKGVMIEHKNIVRLVKNSNYIEFNKGDRILQTGSIVFDACTFEIWGALLNGLTLYIISKNELLNANSLKEFINKNKITTLWLTSPLFNKLCEEDVSIFENVKYLLTGGDVLSPKHINKVLKNNNKIKIINGYGPTENTTFSCCFKIDKQYDESIPIGKPISNSTCYIVSKNGKLQPIGVPGELWVGGDGVARGYLNNEELTKEKFINNYYENAKIYKTGDLVKWLPDGNIEFLGRIDNQVKVRGFRVELNEINLKILKFEEVKQSYTTINNFNGEKQICSYVVFKNKIYEKELKEFLRKSLPAYMVPTYIITLDKLPLNINGKVEKQLLPQPNNIKKDIVKPRNDIDEFLINTLEKILKINDISIEDYFLELGGDSLSAISFTSMIYKKYNIQITVRDILDNMNIKELSDFINNYNKTKNNMQNKLQDDLQVRENRSMDYLENFHNNENKIKKAPKQENYPLSSAQKRIYYATKMMGESNLVYNVPAGILVDKILDKNKINEIFNLIIKNNSIFRTVFILDENGDVKQKVLENVNIKIKSYNNTNNEIQNLVDSFPQPFNLEKAPLLRVELHYIDNKKTLLLFDSHHIVMDGTSTKILINDFCNLYNNSEKYINENNLEKNKNNNAEGNNYLEKNKNNNTEENKNNNIEENNYLEKNKNNNAEENNYSEKNKNNNKKINKLEYIDYSNWENNYIKSNEIKKIENYWLNKFENKEIPILNFPYDIKNISNNYEGNKIIKNIPEKDFLEYEENAKKMGVSPYMLFLSVFFVLLYKYTGQQEILIGTPTANREKQEIQDIIGMFVNNIVIYGKINPKKSFKDFVQLIKKEVIDDLTNGSYPFDLLPKKLNIQKDNYSNPLFDVMFLYQNTPDAKLEIDNEPVQIIQSNVKISKFNLSVEIDPYSRNISFEYRTDLLKRDTVLKIYKHYINLLNLLVKNQDILLKDIPILIEDEKNKILFDFNNTYMEYSKNKTIIQLFEEQVEKTPNNIALIFENKKLTYKELNEKANMLGNYLKNIEKNNIIAIMVDRSLELIIAMLAVLKSGSAYLPIDPTYPEGRIKYILEDSKVQTILTFSKLKEKINFNGNIIELDNDNIFNNKNINNLKINNSSEDVAYVIYTSGSTGNPKGVQVTNRNVVNFTEAMCEQIDFKGTIVSVTTYCFDIFVLESLLPLQKGMTIVLANEQEQNIPQLLNKICVENNVTMLQTTPSRMSLLLSNKDLEYLQKLKTIMLGGEPFPEILLGELQQVTNAKIYNMYGPTETTVWSSVKELTNSTQINIGRPIGNTQFYILDDNLNVLPTGVIGNLYIGGDGVSKGYLYREDLNKNKFINNPFKENDTIYNTGDLAKWTKDGEVICIGRLDFQVKINGLRIELGEIENKIMNYPNIKNAVVTVKKDATGRELLCGYFISDERISSSDLKDFLNKFLPNYMVPTYLIQLSNFEYTPNGKIDRKALPVPHINKEKNIVLPETDTEIEISKIFSKLLAISPISINENFFEIGGDSILALKLQIELLNKGINISYSDIYKYNTIKQLALRIDMIKNNININNTNNQEYDFSEINKLLKNNENLENKLIEKNEIGNVLLTGATGFLGAHILAYIMENTEYSVYCLIRKNPSTEAANKLLKRLNYYFGDKYNDYINKRIFVIESDVTQDNLGISNKTEKLLDENISSVINSAANVKHYGYYSDFEKINVIGVKNLVEFSKKYNKKFVQISTISVSGNTLFNLKDNKNDFKRDVFFRENNLYINQNLDNVYVRSKFEAEKFILENILYNNLNAIILRVGNITNRSTDGKFQFNNKENAFANRIKAFMEIGFIPEYLKNIYAEFSPVDNVAEAVVKATEYAHDISVLHVYNQNHVYITDLIEMLPNNKVKFINNNEFYKILQNKLNDKNNNLIYLANDLDENKKLIYESKIKIKNDFSKEFFEKIGFKWSTINKSYIKKILDNI